MKLKILREHFQSPDEGLTWIPKRPFNSKSQIKRELGFDLSICPVYTCNFCGKLHVATPKKDK